MMHFVWQIAVCLLLCTVSALNARSAESYTDYQPQQIHIAFGGKVFKGGFDGNFLIEMDICGISLDFEGQWIYF